jgi:hypothetical protein
MSADSGRSFTDRLLGRPARPAQSSAIDALDLTHTANGATREADTQGYGPSSSRVTQAAVSHFLTANPAPRPNVGKTALLASAAKITSKQTKDPAFRKIATINKEATVDAWAMYDLVGEVRYVVDNIAQRSSKAHFYIGKLSESGVDAPKPLSQTRQDNDTTTPVTSSQDREIASLIGSIGDGQVGLGRLIERLVANLKVPGEGWLVGIPEDLLPDPELDVAEITDVTPKTRRELPRVDRTPDLLERDRIQRQTDEADADSYAWRMLSTSEIDFEANGSVVLTLGATEAEKLRVTAEQVYMIRVHKPHPQQYWRADSPIYSNLPVLRELVGLTMHISAQVDSRLAGAGVFIVPESYSRAVKRAMGLSDDDPNDPVTEGLMQAMLTPISDRSAASALVPLVLTVPDESADKFRHITFDKGLDSLAADLRTESIRRFALGFDAPPDLLLGAESFNHWGVWLSREDVIRAHVEPTLALICDALTVQWLRPLLKANFPDLTRDELDSLVVWYDVEHLIVRASSGQDAKDLYDKDELSGTALRRANGFDETDAPKESDSDQKAIDAVFTMVSANPGLMRRPGLDVLVKQMKALLDGSPLGADDMVSDAVQAEVEATATEEAAGVDVEATGAEGGPDAEAGAEAAPEDPTATTTEPATNPGMPSTSPGTVPSSAPTGLRLHDPSEFGDLRGSLSSRYDVDVMEGV